MMRYIVWLNDKNNNIFSACSNEKQGLVSVSDPPNKFRLLAFFLATIDTEIIVIDQFRENGVAVKWK